MEQLVWPDVTMEELPKAEPIRKSVPKRSAAPGAVFGLIYAAGILWGSFAASELQPDIKAIMDSLLSDFLSSLGTGSTIKAATELFLPPALLMAVIFLGNFSAFGFLGSAGILLIKGAVYGLMAAGLQGEGNPLIVCAGLLAPFEALGSFCAITLSARSLKISLRLLKALGGEETSAISPLKSFLEFLGLILLLFLFALLSAAVCGYFAPTLLES